MRWLVVTLILAFAGCSGDLNPRRPDEVTVDRIERQLAKLPCPGVLDRWERHYTFVSRPVEGSAGWENRRYDYNRIDIDLRQAGFEEFRGGRHIHARMPAHQAMIDDRPYDVAFGEYDISADKLMLKWCGPNM